MKKMIAILMLGLIAQVYAEDAAPTAATPAAPECKQPDTISKFASDNQRKVFQRRVKEYSECIKKFVDEQNQLAQAAIGKANAAINEQNAYIKKINESQQEQ
ncbi:hypothetical protein KSF73_09590 [Burkholderiaceae bacterium DAT-1]|nr:hypothetical protein [Burkholderiaceae bacterium DAT-1]